MWVNDECQLVSLTLQVFKGDDFGVSLWSLHVVNAELLEVADDDEASLLGFWEPVIISFSLPER